MEENEISHEEGMRLNNEAELWTDDPGPSEIRERLASAGVSDPTIEWYISRWEYLRPYTDDFGNPLRPWYREW